MTRQSSNASLLQWLRAQRPILVFAAVVGVVALLFYAQKFARRTSANNVSVVYGERNSSDGRLSINGTAVLAEMLEEAGFRVSSWNRLSPKLQQAKVIIWAPDDFAIPTPEQRQWLEDWLAEEHYRRLVYIGRDYDAELDYWQKTGVQAPVEQLVEIDRRIARKKAQQDLAEQKLLRAPAGKSNTKKSNTKKSNTKNPSDENEAVWFTKEQKTGGEQPNSSSSNRTGTRISGPWSEGIDAENVELYLHTRLRTPENEVEDSAVKKQQYPSRRGPLRLTSEVLLRVDGDAFVTRLTRNDWWQGKILVVANGSFLLNMPLVNREHRKLAEKLIKECGTPGKLVFLESGVGGPPIRENDESHGLTGLEMLFVAPLNVILLHFLAAGVVLLVGYFPVFGRPRELKPENVSDFSRHIEAMGEQLEVIGELGYCVGKLRYYNEHVRQETSSSPRSAPANVERRPLRIRITTPIAPGAHDHRVVEEFSQQVHHRSIGQVLHTAFDTDGMEIILSTPATAETLVEIQTLLEEFQLVDNSVVSELARQPLRPTT